MPLAAALADQSTAFECTAQLRTGACRSLAPVAPPAIYLAGSIPMGVRMPP